MDRSEKLAEVLAEFAHTLVAGFAIQGILDHLVARIVDILPVTGAGVMLMGPNNELHFVAASNDTILEIESLQNKLNEGPCLEAYRSGKAVAAPDLTEDVRFPKFSPGALEAGLAAVFTFPMSLDGHRFGALDLYRDTSGALDAWGLKSAQVLADVAAAYIHNANDRADAADTLDVMRQRSLHDPLTSLPNRTLFKERLEQAVARARRSQHAIAVFFVDLDRFKAVNDEFGHHIGDQLLVAVAQRLATALRPGDTLARLSGDEFVIICEDLATPDLADHVADRITAVLGAKFKLEGTAMHITASVGFAVSGPGEDVPENLIRDADLAMYRAKHSGGARHQRIDPAVRRAADRRHDLVRDLRFALERDEFRLAYQPIVDARQGLVEGLEALLRWQRPDDSWMMPSQFLPAAEMSGLILEIGEWVLTQACRDLQRWQRLYGSPPHVTVNVSPYQVMAPHFDMTVKRAITSSDIDPSNIFLEVTESAFIEDGPRAFSVLEEIRQLSVGLILDDFGTGYSSLGYLRRFTFDMLKIDRDFISNLTGDASSRTIVAAIVDLAHGLDLRVVAEGVETKQQLREVIDLRVDRAQGYYFCRPLPVDQLEERILEPIKAAQVRLPHPRQARLDVRSDGVVY